MILWDPQRKTVLEKTVPVDAETKSFTLETELAADANLGRWSVQLKNRPYSGYLSFTVEEYKKPEYVLDLETPAEPVKCGDKITVRMKAAYFFGAPMAGSKIKYTVNRTEHQQLFPFFFRYSWLFGNRYGICTVMLPLAENDKKHNYRNIGNVKVASGEALTNDNGEFTLTLDTEKDAAVFAGKDFSYSIEASVADATGRVVTARGSVTAAAVPFRVHIYTPWGFVSTGKPAEIRVKAITADGKDVEGRGIIRIFRKTVKDGVPARTGTVLKSVEFTLGKEPPRVVFDQPGVYDCEAEVVSANGITQKQSATLFVTGEKQSDSIFSEVPLQISTDKPEYKPGETAHLRCEEVGTGRPDRNRSGEGLFRPCFPAAHKRGSTQYLRFRIHGTGRTTPHPHERTLSSPGKQDAERLPRLGKDKSRTRRDGSAETKSHHSGRQTGEGCSHGDRV